MESSIGQYLKVIGNHLTVGYALLWVLLILQLMMAATFCWLIIKYTKVSGDGHKKISKNKGDKV